MPGVPTNGGLRKVNTSNYVQQLGYVGYFLLRTAIRALLRLPQMGNDMVIPVVDSFILFQMTPHTDF